ncbi:thiol:disulfide interchange protein DsbD [Comamonas sp. BIGb0152]|uniref:protein-disulfide reductase DsbD family protein n=1 Tax=Comamonas sp. BIGb0152 TaxID=2940601 RepID=UPI002169A3E1|nr:thioredoxin family protein [Comamonas sp. BIGb0152]MCS4293901.1 thiol:disulfide interchange protein DsbD [Comamonas sp. BIGb0152]
MPHAFMRRSIGALFFTLLVLVLCANAGQAQAQIKLQIGSGTTAAAMDSSSGPASSNVVTTPRVRAELVALAPQGIEPGKTIELGLLLDHQPDWHTYWANPGDSGLPTQLQWQLPPAWDAGEIAWPTPHPIRVGTLVNYGYEGQVLLPVTVQIPSNFSPDARDVTVRLHANWLICRVECIPEEGQFSLTIPTKSSTALLADTFAQAHAQVPVALQGSSQASVDGETLKLRVSGLPAALQGQSLQVLSESPDTLHHAMEAGKDFNQQWDGADWTAVVPLSANRGQTPDHIPLVLTTDKHTAVDGAIGWRAVAPISGQWQAAAVAQVSPELAAALAKNAQTSAPTPPPSSGNLWLAVLGALVGGLILNLMPCVFPILALKVLGFTAHGSQLREQRHAGLAYTAGVVLSFLALGALLLALRSAGQQLGWGFQLQSPLVIAALAALFTVIGLNLAGMFEFGSFVPSSLAGKQAKSPITNAFLSGVLAVAIASPCTAPFMGASMGLAVSLPAAEALLVFAALGLGMAAPYLLASWIPAVVRWLPRPGAWMDTFRRAMAFPMFATVVWLVWVLGQQSGIDGAATLLALLVLLAALVWALGLQGRARWAFALLSIAGGLYLASAMGHNLTTPAPAPGQQASGALWQPWSAQKVGEINASGKPVFVDFTAAWCVTCQYNKRTTLSDSQVLSAFEGKQVSLLRADWTRQDPAITQALNQLGRSGVPVYVLYAPGKAPQILSEVLSVKEVVDAVAQL